MNLKQKHHDKKERDEEVPFADVADECSPSRQNGVSCCSPSRVQLRASPEKLLEDEGDFWVGRLRGDKLSTLSLVNDVWTTTLGQHGPEEGHVECCLSRRL